MIMKVRALSCVSVITLLTAPAISGQLSAKEPIAQNAVFITFDAPGASLTFPTGINSEGVIMGNALLDSNDNLGRIFRGFVRARDGTFTTFDAPNVGQDGTWPVSINSAGEITGYSYDANNMTHGFLRKPDGVITVLDGPGALETFAVGINETGTITGWVEVNPDGSGHAFLRSPDGEYTLFDVPPEVGTNTAPSGINAAGAVTGSFTDRNFNYAGFVRTADGTFSYFYAPNGGQIASGLSIDSGGDVTGWYWDRNGEHGFVRTADGTFSALNAPRNIGCVPTSINPAGDITGNCIVNQVFGAFWGAFVQERNGRFFRLDVPSTIQTVGPSGINSAGEITGTYYLAPGSGYPHAFLRTWRRRKH
jgi:hypothetical protein